MSAPRPWSPSPRATNLALAVAVVGVGAYAVLRRSPEAASAQTPISETTITPSPSPLPPVSETEALPPGHPDIGGTAAAGAMGAMGATGAPALPPNDDAPSVTWKAPAGWTTIPNPSTMRLATYRVPRAAGVTDDADLAITRAGGTTDANIERWVGQFDRHGKETRTVKTVRGLTVTIVEMSGVYLSGGMGGGASISKPGWSLLAAIIEAPGTPYFFKLTGPSASVAAARASFVSLVDSVSPS